MTREERDDMAGGLSNREDLVVYLSPPFNRRWRKSHGLKPAMRCPQIVNHQVERSITGSHALSFHHDEVGASAHFIYGDLRSVEDGPHANGPHELSRLSHAIRMQHNMRHADSRPRERTPTNAQEQCKRADHEHAEDQQEAPVGR